MTLSFKSQDEVKIAFIGAGSYTQALASVYNQKYKITIWNHSPKRIEVMKSLQNGEISFDEIKKSEEYSRYVHYDFSRPMAGSDNIRLLSPDENTSPEDSMAEVYKDKYWEPDITFITVPSSYLRETAKLMSSNLTFGHNVITGTKGKEMKEDDENIIIRFPYQVTKEEFKGVIKYIGTGFNLYTDILSGAPQYMLLSSGLRQPKGLGKSRGEMMGWLTSILSTRNFNVSPSGRLNTPQIAGSLKSIIAMDSGLLEGYKPDGRNAPYDNMTTRLNLINSFVNNFLPLVYILGGNTMSFLKSPDSITDVYGTVLSPRSRNREAGVYKAQGIPVDELEKKVRQTVEGLHQLEIVKKIIDFHPSYDPANLVSYTWQIFHENADIGDTIEKILHKNPADYVEGPKMLNRIDILGAIKDRWGLSGPVKIPKDKTRFDKFLQSLDKGN